MTPYGGLPLLLESVGSASHPDEVAAAIVAGPGRDLGAQSAAVLWANGPHLVIVGASGYRPQEVDGLATVDLSGDFPLCHAYWEGEAIVVPSREVSARYAGMARPGSRWEHLHERIPDGDHVSAPIHSDGHAIGAFALNCVSPRKWSTLEIACLDAIGHALGLWMTHPDSGLPVADAAPARPVLSARQRAIMVLVHEGRTNTSIAHALGLSVSTVKQEIARCMSTLDVADRHAAAARALDLDPGEAR